MTDLDPFSEYAANAFDAVQQAESTTERAELLDRARTWMLAGSEENRINRRKMSLIAQTGRWESRMVGRCQTTESCAGGSMPRR